MIFAEQQKYKRCEEDQLRRGDSEKIGRGGMWQSILDTLAFTSPRSVAEEELPREKTSVFTPDVFPLMSHLFVFTAMKARRLLSANPDEG